MIGKQLLNFQILEQIGAGGMGVVYRAFDEKLQRPVALKLLHQGALADEVTRQRFLDEARTASGLNHRNIVTIHQIDEVEGRDFIAMEFVDGQTLDEWAGDEAVGMEDTLQYALQIGQALAFAHEHGIVHRDLKPHNVMLTGRREIKVLDFGLAKRFDPQDREIGGDEETSDGFEGTPAYMSPEQVERKKIDARSDMFAYGSLVYEMLTGISPFKRRSPLGMLQAVLQDHPEPPSTRREDVPKELDGILAKAMAKKPTDRYVDMRELLAELQHLWTKLYGTGTYEYGLLEAQIPVWRRHARRLAAGAAMTIALVAGLFFWLGRGTSAPSDVVELTDFKLLSTFPGSHRQSTLSPDGTMLAFVTDDDNDTPQLWRVPIEGGEPEQLTHAEASVERPVYTPDGSGILFGRRDEGLWRYDVASGDTRRVLEQGSWPSVAADGDLMVFEREKRLWLASIEGADPRPLESVEPLYFAEWVRLAPALSPDGSQVAYFAPELGPTGNLWLAPLDGGEPRQLTGRRFRGGQPAWTPDGDHLIFQADFQGGLTLWSIAVDGGDPVPLTRGAGQDGEVDVTADGRSLVYTASRHTYRLVRQTGDKLEILHDSRLPQASPALSPDEQRIAYFSTDGPDFHIFSVELSTASVTQLTDDADAIHIVPRWSGDGEWIYFYTQRPAMSLKRVPVGGGPVETVLESWDWNRQNASTPSPDGRLLAYTLFEDSQPLRTLVRDLETGEERALPEILRSPVFSPDGTRLAGFTAGDVVWMCPVSGDPCTEVDSGSFPRWTHDGAGLAFVRPVAGEAIAAARRREIWLRSPLDAEARRLALLDGVEPLIFDYDLTTEGSIVWNQDLPGRQELWIASIGG
ncbi:MAG: protein kinase [Acidobacteriota bacterium]